jgi:hypothetical protein
MAPIGKENGMTEDMNVLKKSVTADDGNTARANGPVSVFVGPSNLSAFWNGSGGIIGHIAGATGLPYNGSKRADIILSESVLVEDMWSSAIFKAVSKQTALGFTIADKTESTRRIRQAQELMLNYDGGYEHGLSRHLRDFLCTDNGAFIEIVRQSGAAGSKVIGLRHLDSLRCYRTGDPQRPVVYVDRAGVQHLLRADDVIYFSDMPSPRMEMYGVGICAARRAFATILKVVAMETYFREKVSGSRSLAIHIVNGITAQQLEGALNTAETAQRGKGFVVYRGSTLIPMLKDEPPALVTIPLAEIADGFNVEQERRNAYLTYANAIGVFVGEIQPLSQQGLGTGTQSVVLSDIAEGTGLAAWRKLFTNAITHRVMPETTVFSFATSDYQDKLQRADGLSKMGAALKTLIDAQVITNTQALNVLVDEQYLPREFLQTDETAGGAVVDTDAVTNETAAPEAPAQADTINGQSFDIEAQPVLREKLRRVKTSFKALQKNLLLNSDTWSGTKPEATLSEDEILSMLRPRRVEARRLAKRAQERL